MDLETRVGLRTFFHWDAMKEVGKFGAGANLWRGAMHAGNR
jgi:hypothetical protein